MNLAYVVAQIVFGILAHSLALLADAGHDFGDVLGLLLAWGATYLAKTRPTARRTYGLGRSSILAALANAILLMVAVGGISWEAIRRFANPAQVGGKTQVALQQQGYYTWAVDGRMGPLTRAAIARYQRDHLLPITSGIDPATLGSLGVIR